jgi:hypothetical protein
MFQSGNDDQALASKIETEIEKIAISHPRLGNPLKSWFAKLKNFPSVDFHRSISPPDPHNSRSGLPSYDFENSKNYSEILITLEEVNRLLSLGQEDEARKRIHRIMGILPRWVAPLALILLAICSCAFYLAYLNTTEDENSSPRDELEFIKSQFPESYN